MKKTFTGVERWLEIHASEAAGKLFDDHGWKQDWLSKTEIGEAVFPTVKSGTARKYIDALLQFLVEEGVKTGRPQVAVNRGKFTFEPNLIPNYSRD